ncbi:hypothetical protein V6N13_132645 [Hibiscus sabdariffa]
MEKKKYPIGPEHYTLYEEVGQGVSASVYRALCIPSNDVVAIKILDFERENCDLNNIFREAQTMVLVDHPNVLKSHCSFVNDHNLWVVMPYMAGGSCLHILKAAYPDGFEEVVIATILREVLKGLEYLHQHGHIHRDVKAGNILIDSRGAIKLGDFGVSACIFDSGDRQRMRNTFVGTPCWMAPEVLEQLHGYDFKADIWSFGITALELAHGHAPFSKYPPMKVLLMTLQNAPPGLDYERDKKFSKSFKQMIASCLVKDPSKRPSATKLLKHSFFRQARSNDYIARTLLEGLPALGDRIQALKRKEEDMLAQKKMPDGEKEELSQNEYKRGISGWDFNLEDMKAQASLIQDDDLISDANLGGSSNSLLSLEGRDKQSECQTSSQATGKLSQEDNNLVQNQPAPSAAVDPAVTITKFERSDDDSSGASASHELNVTSPSNDDRVESNLGEKPVLELNGKPSDNMTKHLHPRTPSISGSTSIPDTNVLPVKGERFGVTCDDEKAKPPFVQQKGRFKVTSENVGLEKVAASPLLQKSRSMQVGTSEVLTTNPTVSPAATTDLASSIPAANNLFPLLQSVLQTNILQREYILNVMKQVCAGDPIANRAFEGVGVPANVPVTEKSLLELAHDREKELLHEVTELQWRYSDIMKHSISFFPPENRKTVSKPRFGYICRLICAQEELLKYKTENGQVSF